LPRYALAASRRERLLLTALAADSDGVSELATTAADLGDGVMFGRSNEMNNTSIVNKMLEMYAGYCKP